MGEVAEQVGRFVNAYSGDLKDESLDGQRVVVGGIVTGLRTVITKRQESMAIVDPRGPAGLDRGRRLPAAVRDDAAPTWRDGAILLVAGRVDHKGEEVSLLADLVADWDDAVGRAAPRRSPARSRPATGAAATAVRAGQPVAVGPGAGAAGVAAPAGRHGRHAAAARRRPSSPPTRRTAIGRRPPPDAHAADRARREPVPTYLEAAGADRVAGIGRTSATMRAVRARRGARPDRRRRHGRCPGRGRSGRDPARPLRGRRRPRPAGQRHGDGQGRCCATGRGRRGSSSTCRRPGGGEALPDGAAPRRRLRRRAVAEVRRRLGDGLVDLRLASA